MPTIFQLRFRLLFAILFLLTVIGWYNWWVLLFSLIFSIILSVYKYMEKRNGTLKALYICIKNFLENYGEALSFLILNLGIVLYHYPDYTIGLFLISRNIYTFIIILILIGIIICFDKEKIGKFRFLIYLVMLQYVYTIVFCNPKATFLYKNFLNAEDQPVLCNINTLKQYQELDQIVNELSKEESDHNIIFHGISGIGKSTLLKKYAYNNPHVLYVELDDDYDPFAQMLTQMGDNVFDPIKYFLKDKSIKKAKSDNLARYLKHFGKFQISNHTPVIIFDEVNVLTPDNLQNLIRLSQRIKKLYKIILASSEAILFDPNLIRSEDWEYELFPTLNDTQMQQYAKCLAERICREKEINWTFIDKYLTSSYKINKKFVKRLCYYDTQVDNLDSLEKFIKYDKKFFKYFDNLFSLSKLDLWKKKYFPAEYLEYLIKILDAEEPVQWEEELLSWKIVSKRVFILYDCEIEKNITKCVKFQTDLHKIFAKIYLREKESEMIKETSKIIK